MKEIKPLSSFYRMLWVLNMMDQIHVTKNLLGTIKSGAVS